MNATEWLLLFLSDTVREEAGPTTVDPLRIQKAMFLLSERGPERGIYSFQPYHWGPFSRDIYTDLATLERRGLITSKVAMGRTWHTYNTTSAGAEAARGLARGMSPEAVQWVANVRSYVTGRPFVQLLREIYAAFPEYSTRTKLV